MKEFIKIHQNDNVAVALTPLSANRTLDVDGTEVTLREDIPQGHKFALTDIPADAQVIKYGCPIGIAKENISCGSWIHTHNIRTGLGDLLTYTYDRSVTELTPTAPRTFRGYRRSNGKVGIRNEIWIIPTVGCVNNVATAIERKAQKYVQGSVEGIFAFPHPYGCSQMGDDQENTRKILSDLINHPNAGGVLVLGLGCENSNIDVLKNYIGDYDPKRVRFLVAQESEDEIADALNILEDLSAYVGSFEREDIDCSELVIGMKVLTEVPEMFGAETQLMNRCEDEVLFEKTVDLINNFKQYFQSHNQTIYENPSPGNKKGGISTLEDKSLGCTQKSGSAPVMDVLSYAEQVKTKGLNLLSAPGNDLVASTALAASGAHIVLFTTGRGTPFACPVPTMKISTNSSLNNRKQNWIDFNCGTLVEGDTLPELAEKLFDEVIAVASGKEVKSEIAGFHDMAIFKQGVTL